MLPEWARLLRQYRDEGHFGLTPSFLIGAMRKPVGALATEEASLTEFRSLLESMRDQPVGFRVRVLKCARLQRPVAALADNDMADPSEESITPRFKSEPRLFVWHKYLAEGSHDVETVVGNLWRTFRRPICAGRFSYRNDRFLLFNTADLEFIQRALTVQRRRPTTKWSRRAKRHV